MQTQGKVQILPDQSLSFKEMVADIDNDNAE